MTWIKFALWLSGLYVTYYLILIIWDAFSGSRPALKEDNHELTFVEHFEPQRPESERAAEFPSAVMSSGGVSLKQLFSLAREEAVEFTRPVSFI